MEQNITSDIHKRREEVDVEDNIIDNRARYDSRTAYERREVQVTFIRQTFVFDDTILPHTAKN